MFTSAQLTAIAATTGDWAVGLCSNAVSTIDPKLNEAFDAALLAATVDFFNAQSAVVREQLLKTLKNGATSTASSSTFAELKASASDIATTNSGKDQEVFGSTQCKDSPSAEDPDELVLPVQFSMEKPSGASKTCFTCRTNNGYTVIRRSSPLDVPERRTFKLTEIPKLQAYRSGYREVSSTPKMWDQLK